MNTLTPEQLDMIKRLQPVFNSNVKEWADDDLCYCGDCGHLVRTYYKHSQGCPIEPLWIPKVYDWQNPERGLWGMVDWKAYTFDIKYDGTVFLNKRSLTLQIDCISIGDIFTALLKALCEQEGV